MLFPCCALVHPDAAGGTRFDKVWGAPCGRSRIAAAGTFCRSRPFLLFHGASHLGSEHRSRVLKGSAPRSPRGICLRVSNGAMLIISFAGQDKSAVRARERWEARLKKIEESRWLQHTAIQHRMCWPPKVEDGWSSWGRSAFVFYFSISFL